MKIPLIRLDVGLPLPSRAHPHDAGIDLRSREDFVLSRGERRLVPTGLAVAIPEGHTGLVTPRSGLAIRHGIGMVNAPGVVDAGYRGELQVILINHGDEPVTFARGDRIAQLVVVAYADVEFVETDELPESVRGQGGFGSSGR